MIRYDHPRINFYSSGFYPQQISLFATHMFQNVSMRERPNQQPHLDTLERFMCLRIFLPEGQINRRIRMPWSGQRTAALWLESVIVTLLELSKEWRYYLGE